jgi:hypothetical protein
MSTGDPIIHCPKCNQSYYLVNGHDCSVKDNIYYKDLNIQTKYDELLNKINILLEIYNNLPMMVKLFIPPKIRIAIENLVIKE